MVHDPTEREAKRRTLEDFHGTDVGDWLADRVIVRDIGPAPEAHPAED